MNPCWKEVEGAEVKDDGGLKGRSECKTGVGGGRVAFSLLLLVVFFFFFVDLPSNKAAVDEQPPGNSNVSQRTCWTPPSLAGSARCRIYF